MVMEMRGDPGDLSKGTHPWYEKGYTGFDNVAVDTQVSRVPVELVSLLLTASQGNCTVVLYDGSDADAPVLMRLAASQDDSFAYTPAEPVKTTRGLFVGVGSNVGGLFLQWRPIPKGWRV